MHCSSRPVFSIFALSMLLGLTGLGAQVITVDTRSGTVTSSSAGTIATIDVRYRQVTPTKVELPTASMDEHTRATLIRALQAEQGFAMRPLPRGHKGLMLEANGLLSPYGEEYVAMAASQGISAKPGDRVAITDIRFDHSKIVLDLNGGPDPRHRFLDHIQIGMGPMMGPVVNESGQEPVGARVSILFKSGLPALSAADVKALLAPLVTFDTKTQIQAFTDTLPSALREAILAHRVLVGMNTDMVLFALGQPDRKMRETEGQTPFEEWIYGKPPAPVQFVRVNGNRVIRYEIAKVGEKPQVFTEDVVQDMMMADGTPVIKPKIHTIAEGDTERDSRTQAQGAPPSLRKPGETLPNDDERTGVKQPVHPVVKKPQPGENPEGGDEPAPANQPANASHP